MSRPLPRDFARPLALAACASLLIAAGDSLVHSGTQAVHVLGVARSRLPGAIAH
jgi:hypothetical protein